MRTRSPEREQAVVRRTAKALADVCGAQIKGLALPRLPPQPADPKYPIGERFVWDSSLINDDLPCWFDCAAGKLIEIPFTTSTADKTFIGYSYPMRGGPDGERVRLCSIARALTRRDL